MVSKFPNCGSTNIAPYAGLQLGKYQCNDCSYVGPLIIETDETDSRRS